MTNTSVNRVLVVDDDAAMRDMVADGLTSAKMTVETAANAELAYQRVTSGEIDVVVTDLRMPGQSGLDLCSRIVRQSFAVPVIVLTALTAFGDYETAMISTFASTSSKYPSRRQSRDPNHAARRARRGQLEPLGNATGSGQLDYQRHSRDIAGGGTSKSSHGSRRRVRLGARPRTPTLSFR